MNLSVLALEYRIHGLFVRRLAAVNGPDTES